MHYKSPPFHTVIRIHLISLSYHILVILPIHFSSLEQMLMLMSLIACRATSKRESQQSIFNNDLNSVFQLHYPPTSSRNPAPFLNPRTAEGRGRGSAPHPLVFLEYLSGPLEFPSVLRQISRNWKLDIMTLRFSK